MKYQISAPDGSQYEITAPDDATEEQVLAYAKSQWQAPAQPIVPRGTPTTYDPAKGLPTGENLRAGYGKSAADLYRGSKQLLVDTINYANENPSSSAFPVVGPALGMLGGAGKLLGINEQTAQNLRQQADEIKRQDAPLLKTGAGLTGNISGAVVNSLPSAFVPGANTYLGAATTSGLLSALMPVGAEDSRAKNTIIGGGLGLLTNAAFRAVPALWNAGKAYLAPLTKSGQERIAAETVQRFAGNPQSLQQAATYSSSVPGVQPTLAEATLDPGIATLQLATKNFNPAAKTQLLEQEIANNAARLAALSGIAGDDAAREAAVSARAAATGPLYEAAGQIKVPADSALKTLLDRPSLSKAWARAQQLAAEKGEQLVAGQDIPAQTVATGLLDARGAPITKEIAEQSATYSGKGLHYLKMALDDMIDSPQTSGIGKNELGAIQGTKRALLDWMDTNIAPYGQAREAYTKMSAPINQMDIGKTLYEKLAPAITNPDMPTRTTANAYATALRNADKVVKNSTGMDMPLEKIMTPTQMQVIEGVKRDLIRNATAKDLAATQGSTTAQNLAAQSLMRRSLGPLGVPEGWMEGEALPAVFKALMSPYKLVNADEAVNQRLVSLLLDPKKAAAAVKGLPKPVQNSLLLRAANPVTAGLLRANASE